MTSTPPPPTPPTSWDLLNSVPATDYERLIYQGAIRSDRQLAFCYQEAARRLASTFDGQPVDDTILLPYLMLYRQAFELQLKSFTKSLAALRRKHHEPNNPDLESTKVADKLRRKIRHKLEPLLAELLTHYNTLGLSEPFPASVEAIVGLLHQADEPGTYFRYAGNTPTDDVRADFHDLAARFDKQFTYLQAVEDWVDDLHRELP